MATTKFAHPPAPHALRDPVEKLVRPYGRGPELHHVHQRRVRLCLLQRTPSGAAHHDALRVENDAVVLAGLQGTENPGWLVI